MKKRLVVLAMLMCLVASGCGGNTGGTSVSTDTTTETTYGAVSQEEKEAWIAEVGESYDGILVPDETDIAWFLNSDNGSTGASVQGYSDFEGACYDAGACYDFEEDATPSVEWNTEGYNAIDEYGYVSVATTPFSTFGADVDTASYSELRRKLYEGTDYGIADDAVRIEELINYFSYDYNEGSGKFGVSTALTPCPWNEDTLLLRVGVKAEEIDITGGSNIVFLIDTSGSMIDANKLPLAIEAFKTLQTQLTENDTVSIVTYAGSAEVLLEGVKGTDTEKITEALDQLVADGCTDGGEGIITAYDLAEEHFIEGGNNRVILATDGDLNVGVTSEADLISLIEDEREKGIFLTCLGFGEGNYMDDKMEALADHGNGNYAYIDCTREAEKVLREEIWSTLYTVAKDTKFQIEFNPNLVKGYRQIGYENRAMAAEDFADDTKDGGEVGSGQCVTVLYEIVLQSSDMEIPTVESRYGNDEAQSNDFSDELLVINLRYKEPDADTSSLITVPVTEAMLTEEMDADTSWAAGVAQFGMLIKDSEYKGTSTYQSIYDRLILDDSIMEDAYKAEFLYLIQLAMEQED